jgi:hypothetical protein
MATGQARHLFGGRSPAQLHRERRPAEQPHPDAEVLIGLARRDEEDAPPPHPLLKVRPDVADDVGGSVIDLPAHLVAEGAAERLEHPEAYV